MNNYTIEKGKELNLLLGYKGLKSFATLYPNGGSINAWGHPENSTHTLKHEFQAFFGEKDENGVGKIYNPKSGLIRFVDTHTTYFKVAEQTKKLNAWLEVEGAKTVDECIDFLKKS